MPAFTCTSETCRIELLAGGVLLVRVLSGSFNGKQLPDAVFTFRSGDPQYGRWMKAYLEQTAGDNPKGEQDDRTKQTDTVSAKADS